MYPKRLIAGEYVTLYGICIAVGVLLCIFCLRYFGKKNKVDNKFLDFVELLGYGAIGVGFLSSWLFQTFYHFVETGKWDWSQTGITFIGGLIGGVGTFLLVYFLLRKKLTGKIIDILPIAPICITVAHAFGRIGCFFAGCCGGNVAQEGDFFYFLAVRFSHLTHNNEIVKDTYLTYPVQLFEAIFLLIITGIMILLLVKKNFKYNFIVYLPAYGIWRFLIEFARGDERGQIFKGVDWISPSQFFSLIMILLTVPLFFYLRYLIRNREKDFLEKEIEVVEDVTSNE